MADDSIPSSPPTNLPQPDDGLTVRERRALHAKKNAIKGAPGRIARKAIVPGIVILLIAGISAGFYFEAKSQNDCPGHWHAAFAVFVNGTEVRWPADAAHREMYDPPSGHDHHIHNDDGIYHFHPGVSRCISTEDMMERMGVEVHGSSLELSSAHGTLAGTYEPAGNMTLQIWHQPYGKEWRQVSWGSIDGKQLGDGARILITYGVPDAATLQAQQDSLKDLGSYDPGDT